MLKIPPMQSHQQCEAIIRPTIVAEPSSATKFVVEAKAIFTSADRARAMPLREVFPVDTKLLEDICPLGTKTSVNLVRPHVRPPVPVQGQKERNSSLESFLSLSMVLVSE